MTKARDEIARVIFACDYCTLSIAIKEDVDRLLSSLRSMVLSKRKKIMNSLNAQQSFECVGFNRACQSIADELFGKEKI